MEEHEKKRHRRCTHCRKNPPHWPFILCIECIRYHVIVAPEWWEEKIHPPIRPDDIEELIRVATLKGMSGRRPDFLKSPELYHSIQGKAIDTSAKRESDPEE